jgi:hypothetical protein
MGKVLCAGILLLISMSAQGDTCPVPSADSGEPYSTLANSSKREFYLLLNEYMFLHQWTRHSEALSAGFRTGDRVYGDVLKAGGEFNPAKVTTWRHAYEKSGRSQFRTALGSKVDMAAVDRGVIDWVLQVCLGSRRVWSEIRIINDCRFVFAAGLAPGDASRSPVQPLRFEVRGGRCGKWPERSLSAKGDAVQCVRSGAGAVRIELTTDGAGAVRQTLDPLAQGKLPPEPMQQSRLSEPISEVVRLTRSRDFRQIQLGRGCPSCGLYAADIRPSDPDAKILRATTVSSSGSGWQPCPAGLRCGVYEFSAVDDPRLSGCADLTACRVWRLAEGDAEASDVIQLTYQKSEAACVNCPEGMDFEAAHREWQEARDREPAACEVFADLPAQSVRPTP